MSHRTGEQSLNDRVMAALGCYDPQRIEDMYTVGIPDINFTGGWIEDKDVPPDRVPKRADTILRLPHYTSKQRAWHMRRHRCGGKIYVAIEVGQEFFLIRGDHAAQHLGIDWTVADMRKRALLHFPRFSATALRTYIRLDCGLPG